MQNSQKKNKFTKLNKTLLADLGILLIAIIWGGGFVVTKNLLGEMGPFYYIGIRFSMASLILIIIFWKRIKNIKRKTLYKGCIMGMILFLGMVSQSIGLMYTTPAKQGFISGTNVIIVPFLYMLVTREMVEKKAIVGAILATIGLSFIFFQRGVSSFGLGDMVGFFTPIFFAAHMVGVGILVKKEDPINFTIIQLTLTGVLSLLIAFVVEPFSLVVVKECWLELIYLVLLSSIVACLIQNIALKFTFSTHAAVILSTEPVLATIFSFIFWGEAITIKFIIGAAMIFAGILVTELNFGRKPQVIEQHHTD
jgi:drug/metabolite transporter (DMT)-like permease